MALHGLWGWQNTLLAMAGLTLLLSLPMVCCREIPAVIPKATGRDLSPDPGPGLISFSGPPVPAGYCSG